MPRHLQGVAISWKSRLPIVAFVILGALVLALGGFAVGRASITAATPTASNSVAAPSARGVDPTLSVTAVTPSKPMVEVHPWPGARGAKGPGLYYWDMFGGDWMHNPNGAGVGASLLFATGGTPFEGAGRPVTVAAHPAVHRVLLADAVGMVREQWIIQDIGNQTVFVTMEYSFDAEPSGIAEARDILASLVLQEGPTPSGYMLVFVLRGAWDSG